MDQAWKDAISEGLKKARGGVASVGSALQGVKRDIMAKTPSGIANTKMEKARGNLRSLEKTAQSKTLGAKATGLKLRVKGRAIMAGRRIKEAVKR